MVVALTPAWAGARAWMRPRPRNLAVLALVALGWLVLAPSAALADLQSVGGFAFGEQTDVLGGAIVSGPLPAATLPHSGGGAVTGSAASVCVPAGLCGVLRAGALQASTRGSLDGAGSVEGSASVAKADVAAGVVTGDAIRSRCSGSSGGFRGATLLTNVRVGGRSVAANPAPNTVLYVSGVARVTLNEQIIAADSLTVNAVHVQLLSGDVGDVLLPQAHCDVIAQPVSAAAEAPLAIQLALLTMAVLMGAAVVAWRRDPFLLGRTRR
jgi:hypothetical protein